MSTRSHRAGWKAAGWKAAVASAASLVAVAGAGVALTATAAGAATTDTVGGGAFGLSASLGGVTVIPPTPTVTLPATGGTRQSNLITLPASTLVTSATATVRTAAADTGTAAEKVTSSATVDNLLALPGGVLKVGAVTASCTADATGSSGTVTIADLTLGGTPVTVPPSTPTFVLPAVLPGVTVTANHQVTTDTARQADITVDGLLVQLATGTGATVVVAQARCTASGPGILELPTVTGVAPATGATNGGTPVTITGTNFYGPATVTFGGTLATNVTVVSPTEITANSPAVAAAGTVPVTVTTPAGGSGTAGTFTYVTVPVPGHTPPAATGVSPTSGTPSGGGTVVITGTNLCDVSSVYFGSTPAPSFSVSPTCHVLTVTVPPGTPGTVPIIITTLGGTVTAPQGFTYIPTGYWMVASDGGVFSFGGAKFFGSTGSMTLNQPIVAMADTPDHGGYWLFAADGGVFAFGDAQFYGSVPGVLAPQHRTLNKPVVAAEATPDGKGYRLFAADGGVFDFGNAQFVNSLPGEGVTPIKPITAAASTPVGQGYWLTAADGGVFAFGSAQFHGSMGGTPLGGPVAAMSATPDVGGYWLFATDGGVFTFGNAANDGSMGGKPLNAPVAFGVSTSTGDGYWLFAADGGVFTFGGAQFEGSLGGTHLNKPIVGGIGF
ncbi:MAG TPA: choice-of-anchor P family protein [Acidimicrobiales bacterium]|nr:choice-of-anchor P family protein [Acidimicrobiales bacterium]